MGLFKEKKQDFLGIDIGTSGIKIVQLANYNGKARIVTYGMVEMNSDLIRNRTPRLLKDVSVSIKKLLEKSRVSTKICSAALPTFSVFSSVISLPKMDKVDMDSAVKWEAKKFIPLPMEDMILSWELMGRNKAQTKIAPEKFTNEKGFIETQSSFDKVFLTAAPKGVVSTYIDLFKGLGIDLYSLEIESFATARSLIDDRLTTTMIVDIGSITTDVCVVENGFPILNRSIEIGGNIMTKGIAASMNVSEERAEQFKRDFGLVSLGENGGGIPRIIEETLNPMVNEIKYVFDLYRRQGNGTVEKIILSGGSAYLPNIVNYLQSVLNTPVYIGDAWHKVMYPKELKPVLDEIGPRFSVAIGLALKNIV